jgi:hypothetical protein
MRVSLTTDRSGYGWAQYAGQIVDVSPAEARRLIAAGQAEMVETGIETTAIDHRSKEHRSHGRKPQPNTR